MAFPLSTKTYAWLESIGPVLLAVSVSACCGTAAPRKPPLLSLHAADETPEARVALRATSERYAKTPTYRDRGTIISTTWSAGSSTTNVSRFETLFLRDHGLRFQFFNESGERRFVIWSIRGRTLFWHLQRIDEYSSLEEALRAARGVSQLSTATIPRMLLGEPLFKQAPISGGSEMPFCECINVFVPTPNGEAGVTIDTKQTLIRRFREVTRSNELGGSEVTDTVTIYEPEFGAQTAEAMRELESQPW